MIINEIQFIELLNNSKKVILLEPLYKRKYIPLGLAKIATYLKRKNKEVIYQRDYNGQNEDLICITSLFTYDSEIVLELIRGIYFVNSNIKIIIGGVFASLMSDYILQRFPNINIFKNCSKILDNCPPDYTINWQIEEKWKDFSFVFTSRGCPNKCGYCAIPKLEPEYIINSSWKEHIDINKPNIIISDNNLSAHPEHLFSVCEYLLSINKKVIFDNGFDCKYITLDVVKALSKIKFLRHGCRLAFDRMSDDNIFQEAVKKLLNSGISKNSIMVYILFNFNDTPKDTLYRANECIRLGVRPYPQQYIPLNHLNRDFTFIGKFWTKPMVNAFRYFFLMGGLYLRTSFIEWQKNIENDNSKLGIQNKKYKLSEEDFKKFL